MADTLSLEDFKKKVSGSPALKAILLGDALTTLEKHGVNIHDPAVVKGLGLHKPIDLQNIAPVASSLIITITA